MRGKIKILTISTSGFKKKEGISTVILDTLALLDQQLFQIDIAVTGRYDPELIKAFDGIGVTARYLPDRKENICKYAPALTRLMRTEKYDAVYVHGNSATMSIELIIAKLCGCRIRAAHSHSSNCTHKLADRLLRPLFYRSYTAALACGSDAGQWLYPNRPFEIIKNGRNPEMYAFDSRKRIEMREQLNLAPGTQAIGHVGNFSAVKNHAFLIDVVDRLVRGGFDVRLFCMGDGKLRREIEKQAEQRGLKRYILFTGSICNVPDMLQAMDIMLLPSLYEGLPLVALEWQLAGLPCIISENVTKEAAFTDTVLYLPTNDPGLWANTIAHSTRVPMDRIEASRKAVIAAKENGFDIRANAAKLEKCFLRHV